jgi:predicted RNA-binding Zn ribbon-like protein
MTAAWFSATDHDSVLDFLNTVVWGRGQLVDFFLADEDVAHWLRRAGFWNDGIALDVESGALAREARSLREAIRKILVQQKEGRPTDVARLNAALARGSYRIELADDGEGNLVTRKRYPMDAAGQALLPVAMAAADLLARGDFGLIRKCEGDDCPIWFYDRTKAHRRRWCNMALCGNRRKVARFRTRANGESA